MLWGLSSPGGAHALSRVNPTARFTYGFRSASILAALLNSTILLVATGAIAWEAVGRFFAPVDVAGLTVMLVAAIGIAINGFSAWFLRAGQEGDLNIRGAFFHLVGDAAISVGVDRWWRYPADGLELARSRRQYCDIRAHRLGGRGACCGKPLINL